MAGVVGRKALHVVVVLFLVSTATFLMTDLVPGDPAVAVLGANASPEEYQAVRDQLGLDRPVLERYADWVSGAVRGDLGTTLVPPVQDVSDVLASRIPVTVEIALLALVLSVGLALPAAMWSAYRAGGRGDAAGNVVAFGIVSTPSFLLALFLIFFLVFNRSLTQQLILAAGVVVAAAAVWGGVRRARPPGASAPGLAAYRPAVLSGLALLAVAVVLALLLPEFPRSGFERLSSAGLAANLRSAFLPALVLALAEAALYTRVLRADMISTLQEDYVLSARAKGMSTRHILLREALRPSSFSLVTVVGISFGRLLGGTVIVETIFGLPGLGTMMVDAVRAQDFQLVQAGVLVIAVFYVLINAAVDIAYGALDPRVRRARA